VKPVHESGFDAPTGAVELLFDMCQWFAFSIIGEQANLIYWWEAEKKITHRASNRFAGIFAA
jgi:hypothetical protein